MARFPHREIRGPAEGPVGIRVSGAIQSCHDADAHRFRRHRESTLRPALHVLDQVLDRLVEELTKLRGVMWACAVQRADALDSSSSWAKSRLKPR